MLRDAVWRALGTVLDPELDEPITDLDFVASCTVSGDGVGVGPPPAADVLLRAQLLVPDGRRRLRRGVGGRGGDPRGDRPGRPPRLDEINGGVAAHAGFVETFRGRGGRRPGRAAAVLPGEGGHRRAGPGGPAPGRCRRGARGARGADPGTAPPGGPRPAPERRAALGLPAGDDAPLLIHPDGSRVTSAQVPLTCGEPG